MTRCAACAGPFGLIRHYYFRKHFCSEKCKQRFLRRRQQRIRKALAQRGLSETASGFCARALSPA